MKKFVILILSFQIVSSGQFLNEVMKLRNLVQHFVQHNEQDKSISLFTFIRLHYFDENHDQADPQNHQSLPLHHCHGCSNMCCSTFSFNGFIEQMQLDIKLPVTAKILTPHATDFTHQFGLHTIFQPPRLV